MAPEPLTEEEREALERVAGTGESAVVFPFRNPKEVPELLADLVRRALAAVPRLAAPSGREVGEREVEDAARWRYARAHYAWMRRRVDIGWDDASDRPETEERTYFEVRVPDGANLSCAPMLDAAIDAAMRAAAPSAAREDSDAS